MYVYMQQTDRERKLTEGFTRTKMTPNEALKYGTCVGRLRLTIVRTLRACKH